MTDVRITQCPKCDTTFRVSPAQLKVAKGAVRCGACLNVFNAADHFQSEQPLVTPKQDDRTEDMFGEQSTKQAKAPTTPKPKATPSVASGPEKKPVEEQLIDDDFGDGLIHDDMDDDFLIDDDNGLLIDDNSGLDLIDDDEENETTFANDLNEEFLSLDAGKTDGDPFYTDVDKVEHELDEEDGDDESWAQALLDDDEPEPIQAIEPEPVRVAPKQPAANSAPLADLDADLSEAANLASAADIPSAPTSAASKFQYIQADPLELSLPDKKARRMRWVWSGLSLIAVVALCAQLAYFHFEKWSRDPQFRPWYQLACEQLKCQLPPIYDLTQIRTTATPRVSSHPKFEKALNVDILFMNHASYEQPFPILQLSFTDKRGELVAQRKFQPVEYLAGEAAGMSMMPSLVPVHIALEIKDPGPTADNYQVSFIAAK